mgnify:CR=1 FL=1
MPIALPDVNVLLALIDRVHVHHDAANNWFSVASQQGWATCPLTENGFARIVSSPSYAYTRLTPPDALATLDILIQNHAATHHFWSDSVSLRDPALVDITRIRGHKQLTDIYLLALCQQNQGTIVTLDQGMNTEAIISPRKDLILRL